MHSDLEAKGALIFLAATTTMWVFLSDRLLVGILALMGFTVFGIMVVNVGHLLYGSMLILAGVLCFILTLLEIRAKRG